MHEPGELERLLGRNHIAVHDVKRVAGLPHVQPRERTPGAAHGVEGAPRSGSERRNLGQGLLDEFVGLLERLRGDVLQREPAERQRHARLDSDTVQVDELERAAAEVADDTVGPVNAGDDAERRVLGLALAGKHVDLGPADALRLRDECAAVAGVAAGGGRQDPHGADRGVVAQRSVYVRTTGRLRTSGAGVPPRPARDAAAPAGPEREAARGRVGIRRLHWSRDRVRSRHGTFLQAEVV